jgi:hypothetical protein
MEHERRGAGLVRELVRGRRRAAVVADCLRIGLADQVGDEPAPIGVLAGRLSLDRRGARRLLRRAACVGLVVEDPPGSFRGTAASALLRRDAGGALRDEARHVLSTWTRLTWEHLGHSVLTGASAFVKATGTSVFAHLREHPAEAEVFHTFQAGVTRRNLGALRAAGCLPGAGVVVDVGGGTGALLAAVLEASAATRGVLFDLPEVVERVSSSVRLRTVAGDFFEAVPAGGDVYVLSHILHDWPDASAARILDRVAAAMTPAARLLVIENVAPPGPPGLVMAYLDMQMLAAWEGRERTVPEYGELLRGAGLRLADVLTAEPRSGLTVLTATRDDAVHRDADSRDGFQTADQTPAGRRASQAARP